MPQKKNVHYNKGKAITNAKLKFTQEQKKNKFDYKIVDCLYADFQSFMHWNTPADYKVELFDTKLQKIYRDADIKQPPKKTDPFMLLIDVNAPDNRKNDYSSLLYHEFTHIYDITKLYGTTLPGDASTNSNEFDISWYTEANAVMVALMNSYGFHSIDESKNISLSDIMGSHCEMISLSDYCKSKFNSIRSNLLKKNSVNALKQTQYYFGILKFIKRFCSLDEVLYSEFLHDREFLEYFGESIFCLRYLILNDIATPKSFIYTCSFDVDVFKHADKYIENGCRAII